MFLTKKIFFAQETFFLGLMRFSGLRDPENHQNGILAITRATGVDFLRLNTFFRGYAGCWTVWEGSEAVTDQSGTPLGGGVPHGARLGPKIF